MVFKVDLITCMTIITRHSAVLWYTVLPSSDERLHWFITSLPNWTLLPEFWEVSFEHLKRVLHADRSTSGHLLLSLFELRYVLFFWDQSFRKFIPDSDISPVIQSTTLIFYLSFKSIMFHVFSDMHLKTRSSCTSKTRRGSGWLCYWETFPWKTQLVNFNLFWTFIILNEGEAAFIY